MSTLVVLSVGHELSDEQEKYLLETGGIYEDTTHGEPHYHLTPDHSFHIGEVEILMNDGG